MKLEINIETADALVLAVLQDDYRFVKENLQNLKKFVESGQAAPHVVEDYKYDKKLLKAIKKVLRYYMIHEEYQRFIQENE